MTTLSSAGMPVSGANSLQIPWGMAIDEATNIAFVASEGRANDDYTAILLIDLTTGERIIVSNSLL